MPLRLLIFAALFIFVSSAIAQDQFEDGKPVAFPGRPTISNPAYIPAPGYLQFEQGVQITAGAPGVDTQIGINQSTKIALNHRLLVVSQWQPITRTVTTGASETDQGDFALGAQLLITKNHPEGSYKPTLAVGYQRTVHAGTAPDFDAAGNRNSVVLFASGKLGPLDYDANFLFNEQVNGPDVRRLQTGQAIAFSKDITRKLSGSGEIWHFTQPFDHDHAVGTLWALNYTAKPNLVFDAGISRGLTHNSAHWYGFFGCTYLLPHALWHRRQ
ncbi:MAG: hypothetical protein JSS87_05920 [Acidobacteria bacterium]|nr:hypothetical protein [Acidobacteriota bacterium]